MIASLNELATLSRTRVNVLLNHYLKEKKSPSVKLQQAMAYSSLTEGKLLRPLLVYMTGALFKAPWEALDIPAAAIEMIHAFSLIHDDLPAMDNASLRRGKPCCHKVFGEDIAILAGDALPLLAFELITSHPAPLNANARLKMIQVLSHATGIYGMTGGQALDMTPVPDLAALTELYQLKTGALIVASVKLGIIAANIEDALIQEKLITYAENLALAFQIQDDLLDLESTVDITGKNVGLDSINDKKTYPAFVGKEQALAKVANLYENALNALADLDASFELLREFLKMLIHRSK